MVPVDVRHTCCVGDEKLANTEAKRPLAFGATDACRMTPATHKDQRVKR